MNEPSFLDQMLAAPLYLGYVTTRIGLPLAADLAACALAVAVLWGLWRLLVLAEHAIARRYEVRQMHREIEVLLADSCTAEPAVDERVDLLPGVVRVGPPTTPPPPPRPAVRRRGVRVPGRARARRRSTTSSSDRRTR